MASFHTVAVLATILVLQPWPATSDILSPLFDNVCKEVECGKGTCKASNNATLGFACECEPGWKQARLDHEDGLQFMPCVIPNCTMNFSCAEGPSPAQEKEKQANASIFDPCHWVDCGGGRCNKTSPLTHRCHCNEGYYNLLNSTLFPCFRECALGMDCARLGIGVTKNSSSSTPNLADKGDNKASSISRGGFNWLIIVAISLGLLSWR